MYMVISYKFNFFRNALRFVMEQRSDEEFNNSDTRAVITELF